MPFGIPHSLALSAAVVVATTAAIQTVAAQTADPADMDEASADWFEESSDAEDVWRESPRDSLRDANRLGPAIGRDGDGFPGDLRDGRRIPASGPQKPPARPMRSPGTDREDLRRWRTRFAERSPAERLRVDEILESSVVMAGGDTVGDVDDIVFGPDGAARRLIVDTGGSPLDIGDDLHAVAWENVSLSPDGGTVEIDPGRAGLGTYAYGRDRDLWGPSDMADRAWRASSLLGNLVNTEDTYAFGTVEDLTIGADGRISSVIVTTDAGLGGPFAVPFFAYGRTWTSASTAYFLPYTDSEVTEITEIGADWF